MLAVKKNVFSAVLKLSKDGELRTEHSNRFHAAGPATTNARPPNFVLVRWTTRSPRADDWVRPSTQELAQSSDKYKLALLLLLLLLWFLFKQPILLEITPLRMISLQSGCHSCHPSNSVKALKAHSLSRYQNVKLFWALLQQENIEMEVVVTNMKRVQIMCNCQITVRHRHSWCCAGRKLSNQQYQSMTHLPSAQ